jgi:hypothetical protein
MWGVNDIEFKEFFIYGIIQVGISFLMNPHVWETKAWSGMCWNIIVN